MDCFHAKTINFLKLSNILKAQIKINKETVS